MGSLAIREIRTLGMIQPRLIDPAIRSSSSHCSRISSTGMRLQYRGTLDFQGRVNAVVEAGVLRDMPIFGQVVSLALWPVTKLFEYKVTGSLGEPKADPKYLIPKVMLLPFQLPFHPIRTLKGLLPEDHGASGTNAPPVNTPKQN